MSVLSRITGEAPNPACPAQAAGPLTTSSPPSLKGFLQAPRVALQGRASVWSSALVPGLSFLAASRPEPGGRPDFKAERTTFYETFQVFSSRPPGNNEHPGRLRKLSEVIDKQLRYR